MNILMKQSRALLKPSQHLCATMQKLSSMPPPSLEEARSQAQASKKQMQHWLSGQKASANP